MIVYGYAKDVKYDGSGNMFVRVRIPNIHGPNSRYSYNGHPVRNYVYEKDLPYYRANVGIDAPTYNEVVMLQTENEGTTNFIVTGLTGGSYGSYYTNVGE